jgi:hypothetical protein
VNTEQGMIIGLNRESPRWAGRELTPPVQDHEMPQLNQFSDVAWITWKAMNLPPWSTVDHTKGLKYFVSVSVTNEETQRILKRAHEANHWEIEEWPGHTFERGWPETKAILGES